MIKDEDQKYQNPQPVKIISTHNIEIFAKIMASAAVEKFIVMACKPL